MTALMFNLAADQVHLLLDTVAHTSGSPEPWNFCTKMVLLPHTHSVVCGRGSRDLIYQYSELVQSHALARDQVELNDFAAENLPHIAAGCGVGEGVTSSIYQFGLSKDSGEFVGFRHSSRTGFEPEALQPGWGAMPVYDENAWNELVGSPPVDLEALVAFIVKTKAHDDSLPGSERAVIGGELQHLYMNTSEMRVSTCHQFADFEEQFEAARVRREHED